MADPQQIEYELRAYFQEESNLSRNDRFTYLKAIFDKHFAMDNTEHLINNRDFHDIISVAKLNWTLTTMPMKISKEELSPTQVNHFLLLDAFIGYLNRSKLLKKFVKFDAAKK